MANDEVIKQMSFAKADVRKRVEAAIWAILDLAWRYRTDGFSFSLDETLDAEVDKILVAMSDGNLSDAEYRARQLLRQLELEDFADDAITYSEREIDGEDVIFRLDMHATHLKELLALWIGLAAINGYTKDQIKNQVQTYGGMPFLSPLWGGPRKSVFSWGRGYNRNIVNGITVISQDFIATSFAYSSYRKAVDLGASYFIRHRNSNYHCPLCDSYCQRIIPIRDIIFQTHSKCVCYNTYYTSDGKEIKI